MRSGTALAVEPEGFPVDEPCSALDPIATPRIEERIHERTADFTIAIVTHTMRQAARVSDFTAFMYLRQLVEFDRTATVFTTPSEKRRHRSFRMRSG